MISLKRDALVVLVNLIALLGVLLLVWQGKITIREAEHFVAGLLLPTALALRKRTPTASSPPSVDVVVSPSDDPPKTE